MSSSTSQRKAGPQLSHVASGYWHLATLVLLSLLLLSSRYTLSESLYRSLRGDGDNASSSQDVAIAKKVKSAAVFSSSFPDEFLVKSKKKEVIVPTKGDEPEREIAFLMSYPNSGTSYTTKLVRYVSQTHTASNYGHEFHEITGESLPVFQDQPTGPFWVDPQKHPEYTTPSKYVLTKTHCGLRCIPCPPQNYVETTFSFRRRCLRGRKVRTIDGRQMYEEVEYPDQRVSKAVHLIRDPFDNVVSRFHLERHEGKSAETYPSSRDGFRDFCQRMNDLHVLHEESAHFLDQDILDLLRNVPCRSDLIRYVEWHNMAFVTALDMGLETMVLHYDSYTTRFNETVSELLDFLQLPARADPAPFIAGKVYSDYFTEEERSSVYEAFRLMASKTSWKHIERYFKE